MRRKWPGTAPLLGGTAVVLLLAGVGMRTLLARRRQVDQVVGANVAPTPPVPSTSASAAERTVASASPPADVTPDASPMPMLPAPFNKAVARAALDAIAPTLTDCKIPRRRSGQVKVAFSSDGAVSSAKALGSFAASRQGACVANHLREARIAPFKGSAPAFVYTFVIPR
jgi:hypothetical protein